MKKLIILSLVVVSQIYPTVNRLEDCYTSSTQHSLNPALSFKDKAKCIYLSIDPNNPGSPWCSALCDSRVLDAVYNNITYVSLIDQACDLALAAPGEGPCNFLPWPSSAENKKRRPGAAAQSNTIPKVFFSEG